MLYLDYVGPDTYPPLHSFDFILKNHSPPPIALNVHTQPSHVEPLVLVTP